MFSATAAPPLRQTRAAGVDTPAPMQPTFPGGLGRYEIKAELGSGGFATVYQAWDEIDEEFVTLKFFRKAAPGVWDLLVAEEAAHLALGDVPDFVRLRRRNGPNQPPFLVFDYLEGKDAVETIAEAGPFAPLKAVRVTRAVLKGLRSAHERGWIHGDIKPANTLCSKKGPTFVLDLGTAHPAAEPSLCFGTPMYCSPEKLADKDEDGRSDIYSAGCTLFELLSGYAPFEHVSSTLAELLQVRETTEVPDVRMHCEVPKALAAIVSRATKRNPKERFQSVLEMEAELKRFTTPWWLRPVSRLVSLTGGFFRRIALR